MRVVSLSLLLALVAPLSASSTRDIASLGSSSVPLSSPLQLDAEIPAVRKLRLPTLSPALVAGVPRNPAAALPVVPVNVSYRGLLHRT